MPVHDWNRVDAGTFHAFHTGWITHLGEALNGGLLPSGFYAMAEQWATRLIADVLTLREPEGDAGRPSNGRGQGGLAVAEAPPRVRRILSPSTAAQVYRRSLAIRHVSGHRVVAVVEILSPANKVRSTRVAEFVEKMQNIVLHGINLSLVDILPPGPHDPRGIHGAFWSQYYSDEPYLLPPGEPLTMASYLADAPPKAYLEYAAIGAPLPEMPLFLDPDRYINLPLEPTYMAAFRGMPAFWRDMLEGKQAPQA